MLVSWSMHVTETLWSAARRETSFAPAAWAKTIAFRPGIRRRKVEKQTTKNQYQNPIYMTKCEKVDFSLSLLLRFVHRLKSGHRSAPRRPSPSMPELDDVANLMRYVLN